MCLNICKRGMSRSCRWTWVTEAPLSDRQLLNSVSSRDGGDANVEADSADVKNILKTSQCLTMID